MENEAFGMVIKMFGFKMPKSNGISGNQKSEKNNTRDFTVNKELKKVRLESNYCLGM